MGAGGRQNGPVPHCTASSADPAVLVPSSQRLLLSSTPPGTLRSLGGLSDGFLHPQVPGLDAGVTHQVIESLQALHHAQHAIHCLGEGSEGGPFLPCPPRVVCPGARHLSSLRELTKRPILHLGL